jgi:hypothetical protein
MGCCGVDAAAVVAQVPEATARVARAAFPKGSLAMTVRDQLGEVFADAEFAAAFARRDAPADQLTVTVQQCSQCRYRTLTPEFAAAPAVYLSLTVRS